ncbi:MAG: hypothetical protein WCJ84_05280 [Candidatus Peregrinibacteria bacterium]
MNTLSTEISPILKRPKSSASKIGFAAFLLNICIITGIEADIRDAFLSVLKAIPPKTFSIKGYPQRLTPIEAVSVIEAKKKTPEEVYNDILPGDILVWSRETPGSKINISQEFPDNLASLLSIAYQKHKSVLSDLINPEEFLYGTVAIPMGLPNMPLFHMAYVNNVTPGFTVTLIEAGTRSQEGDTGVFEQYTNLPDFIERLKRTGGVILLRPPVNATLKVKNGMNSLLNSPYDETSAQSLVESKVLRVEINGDTLDAFNCNETIFKGLQIGGVIPVDQTITQLSATDLITSGMVEVVSSSF